MRARPSRFIAGGRSETISVKVRTKVFEGCAARRLPEQIADVVVLLARRGVLRVISFTNHPSENERQAANLLRYYDRACEGERSPLSVHQYEKKQCSVW